MEERFNSHLTVGLILLKDNKVVLIKRKNTGYMDGMYGFLAGHVEAHESLKQAVIREAYEEGNITVSEEDLEFVCGIRNGENNNYINFYFKAENFKGELKINEEDKCEEIIWKDINDIPENTIVNDKKSITNMLNGVHFEEYNY